MRLRPVLIPIVLVVRGAFLPWASFLGISKGGIEETVWSPS